MGSAAQVETAAGREKVRDEVELRLELAAVAAIDLRPIVWREWRHPVWSPLLPDGRLAIARNSSGRRFFDYRRGPLRPATRTEQPLPFRTSFVSESQPDMVTALAFSRTGDGSLWA